jgi:hypothetical protein
MFSKLLRRSHMYLALFLAPWILIYALSTMAMNHRQFFTKPGDNPVRFEMESEQTYTGTFPLQATTRQMALQLLKGLNLEGTFSVQGTPDAERITILRQDPIFPRRITFAPKSGQLVVERQVFSAHTFLERMHRRRGYQHDRFLEDAWAVSVDLVIAAIVFWALSGVWMWWELSSTRMWGGACLMLGVALFGLFLFSI